MITEIALAAIIVCTEPRIPFRKFFEQTKGYNINFPPRYYSQPNYVLDIGDAFADYVEYIEARREQCEKGK